MGRFDFVAEEIEAWDPDDALAAAAERHPELPRPRVAVLASQAGPLTFGLRSDDQGPDPDTSAAAVDGPRADQMP
jgi:hypothetical protein